MVIGAVSSNEIEKNLWQVSELLNRKFRVQAFRQTQALRLNIRFLFAAGGATQNTMRFIQWLLGKNNTGIASFLGCIGNDYFGKMMEKKAKADGVKVLYVIDENGKV